MPESLSCPQEGSSLYTSSVEILLSVPEVSDKPSRALMSSVESAFDCTDGMSTIGDRGFLLAGTACFLHISTAG